MDCCRIITMVRCGSLPIVVFSLHGFEPRRTLPECPLGVHRN